MIFSKTLLGVVLAASIFWAPPAHSLDRSDEVGTLEWTQKTGGALTEGQQVLFFVDAMPDLIWASVERVFHRSVPKADLSEFAPPDTPIINEAMNRLRSSSNPAFVNHSIRVAYWTLVVMKRENPDLTPKEIEEAWMAALLHDIGIALPPKFGEFTLGGVKILSELAAEYAWSKESEKKASEAITLNPNSRVDRDKFGLLAWAMNVGGFGETFYGPYRVLMNRENIQELEAMYPRENLYEVAQDLMGKEIRRFHNQRFALLRKVGFLKLGRRG